MLSELSPNFSFCRKKKRSHLVLSNGGFASFSLNFLEKQVDLVYKTGCIGFGGLAPPAFVLSTLPLRSIEVALSFASSPFFKK